MPHYINSEDLNFCNDYAEVYKGYSFEFEFHFHSIIALKLVAKRKLDPWFEQYDRMTGKTTMITDKHSCKMHLLRTETKIIERYESFEIISYIGAKQMVILLKRILDCYERNRERFATDFSHLYNPKTTSLRISMGLL